MESKEKNKQKIQTTRQDVTCLPSPTIYINFHVVSVYELSNQIKMNRIGEG